MPKTNLNPDGDLIDYAPNEWRDKCDQIWENPEYLSNVRMAQCAFLASTVKKYWSPDFVIYVKEPFY